MYGLQKDFVFQKNENKSFFNYA